MSRARTSIRLFTYYIVAAAITFLLFPGFVLELGGFPGEARGLARLFGVALVILAVYYFAASRHEAMRPLWRVTVYTRGAVVVVGSALVLLGEVSWIILPVVALESASGIWTALALRRDEKDALA